MGGKGRLTSTPRDLLKLSHSNKRQQAQNGVICAQSYITKRRLNTVMPATLTYSLSQERTLTCWSEP